MASITDDEISNLFDSWPNLEGVNTSQPSSEPLGANLVNSEELETEPNNANPMESIEPNSSKNENEIAFPFQMNFDNSFQDRLFTLFENKIGTDVTFVVEDGQNIVEVEAHKNILASASPVFFSMFFGGFDSEDIVTVTDCDAPSFQTAIQWAYNGKLEKINSSFKWAKLLHVARKYQIQLLENECSTQLQSLILPSTALRIMGLGNLYDLPQLEDAAWDFVLRNTDKVLRQNSQHLDRPTLLSILSQDSINISEVGLFIQTMAWAKVECTAARLEETPENLRHVLDGLLYLFRFPTMSPEDIANFVVPTQILSMSEIGGIYCRKFTSPTPYDPSYEFNNQPRGRLQSKCNSFLKKGKQSFNSELNERKARRRFNRSLTPTEDIEESIDVLNRGASSSRRFRRRRTRQQNDSEGNEE